MTKTSDQKIDKKYTLYEKFKQSLHHMFSGIRKIKTDFAVMKNIRKQRLVKKRFTIKEYIIYHNIRTDLLKFIPYGILIVIPVIELLIPFYIFLFPN